MARKMFPSVPSAENAAFWAAAEAGTLMVPKCKSCGKSHWYPRGISPFTLGPVEWKEVSGNGTVYTYSVMERANPPYCIAYVALAEGPKMMTNIVDCDPKDVKIGMPVKLKWIETKNGPPMPFFAPA